jgi:hypothetical protein
MAFLQKKSGVRLYCVLAEPKGPKQVVSLRAILQDSAFAEGNTGVARS